MEDSGSNSVGPESSIIHVTLHRPYKRLKSLYRTKVKLQAHLNFVPTCLDLDVIPRGLVIKKTPVVPEVGDMKRLSSIWENTLQKNSRILLKHLKYHYRMTLLTTNSKMQQEQSKLIGWMDFEESLIAINHHNDRIFQQENGWRRQKRRDYIAKLICHHHNKTMEANVLIQ